MSASEHGYTLADCDEITIFIFDTDLGQTRHVMLLTYEQFKAIPELMFYCGYTSSSNTNNWVYLSYVDDNNIKVKHSGNARKIHVIGWLKP